MNDNIKVNVNNNEIEIVMKIKVEGNEEEIKEKANNLTGDCLNKLHETVTKIVNEGFGGLICILMDDLDC